MEKTDYKIYSDAILLAMEKAPLTREEIISIAKPLLPEEKRSDGAIEKTLDAMLSARVLEIGEGGFLRRNSKKPVSIIKQRLEEEILKMLSSERLTRKAIKERLTGIFGTDKTVSEKDDNKLYAFMNQALDKLTKEKSVVFDSTYFFIPQKKSAEIKNRQEILSLMSEFLSLLHSKGGEFFEHYFITLISKYLIRCGKTVTDSKVIGGALDGGIDGIVKTLDSLGFRETIMIQTKNREDHTTETDVRGFYGAVCAMQGSRGIFATSSDFHPAAKRFLDSLDNCVGINGDKIFAMATDTSYGIKHIDGKLVIDEGVF